MRRPFVSLLLVLLVLAGVSFGVWLWAVARIEAGFDDWARQAAAQGWTVRDAARHRTGWPYAAELAVSGLTLTAGPDVVPGGVRWDAARAVLHLSPLAPDVLEVRLSGTQRVRIAGDREAPFDAVRFVLTLPLDAAGPLRLAARDLRFGAPVAGMTIGLLDGTGRASANGAAAELSAEAIALPPPPAPRPPLGRRIASATVALRLDGAWPPPSSDPAAQARQWQKAGGMLRVQHFAMGWGPLGITGTASLGLDSALQPQGTGTVRLIGYDAALSALASGGALAPSAAQAIRAVLALVARAPEGGGAPLVELPLGLRDGVVRAGSIPLGRVPRWDWSGTK
jgi:hypothetical protein